MENLQDIRIQEINFSLLLLNYSLSFPYNHFNHANYIKLQIVNSIGEYLCLVYRKLEDC